MGARFVEVALSPRFVSDLWYASVVCLAARQRDVGSRAVPFIRMAVAHAVRRGLAEAVLRHWRRVADPADVLAGQGALTPRSAAAAAASNRCHPSP